MKAYKNNGAEILADILQARGWTQREAARQLKLGQYGQQTLSALLEGREPKLPIATMLRDKLGIPVEAWLQRKRPRRSDPPPSQSAA